MSTITYALAAAVLVALAAPARAENTCREPIVPPAIDGATATGEQMRAEGELVRGFIADSDVYQECLGNFLDAAVADAKKYDAYVDPKLEAAVRFKLQSNQLLKERVGALYNAAVGVYKSKHPGG